MTIYVPTASIYKPPPSLLYRTIPNTYAIGWYLGLGSASGFFFVGIDVGWCKHVRRDFLPQNSISDI